MLLMIAVPCRVCLFRFRHEHWDFAFRGCDSLQYAIIPNYVRNIGYNVFPPFLEIIEKREMINLQMNLERNIVRKDNDC